MAIAKFTEVCLYTTSLVNPVECHEIKAWLDHSGINYRWLNYNDINQLPEVTKALNTWWTGKTVSQWPFIVYRYEEEESPHPRYLMADFIEGVENIKSQLPEVLASSQTPWV